MSFKKNNVGTCVAKAAATATQPCPAARKAVELSFS